MDKNGKISGKELEAAIANAERRLAFQKKHALQDQHDPYIEMLSEILEHVKVGYHPIVAEYFITTSLNMPDAIQEARKAMAFVDSVKNI